MADLNLLRKAGFSDAEIQDYVKQFQPQQPIDDSLVGKFKGVANDALGYVANSDLFKRINNDFNDTMGYVANSAPFQTLEGPLLAASRAATIGLGDNIVALPAAGIDALKGRDFWDSYEQRRKQIEAPRIKFANESPWLNLGAEVVGGLPLSAAIVGKSAQVEGLKNAILSGMTSGAKVGAAYGAGSNVEGALENPMNPVMGAVESAALGGLLGGPLGALGYGAAKGYSGLQTYLAERGTPGWLKKITDWAKDTPDLKMQGGIKKMEDATKEGIPLYPAEAAGSANLTRLGRRIANNPATTDDVQDILRSRSKSGPERVGRYLDEVSTADDMANAGQSLKDDISAARKIVTDARGREAERTYTRGYEETPTVTSDALEVIKSGEYVKSGIDRAPKQFPSTYGEEPENSTKLLLMGRDKLSREIKKERLAGNSKKLYNLVDEYNKLNEQLDELAPTIRQADAQFEAATKGPVGDIDNTVLGRLLKFPETNPETYANKLVEASPKRIAEVQQLLAPENVDDATIAYLRRGLSEARNADYTTGQGANLAQKLNPSSEAEARIRQLLGEKAGRLLKNLDYEGDIYRGTAGYHPGSSTVNNATDAARGGGPVDWLLSMARHPIRQTAESLANLSGRWNPETWQDMRAVMMPQDGERAAAIEAMKQIRELLFNRAARDRGAQNMIQKPASVVLPEAYAQIHNNDQ